MPVFLMLFGLLLLLIGASVVAVVVVKVITVSAIAFYAFGYVIASAICAFLFAVTGMLMFKTGRRRQREQRQQPADQPR